MCISRNMLKEKTVITANQVSSICNKIIPKAVRNVSALEKQMSAHTLTLPTEV